MGVIEGGYNSVAILVAIRHFQASEAADRHRRWISCRLSSGTYYPMLVGRTSVVVSKICAIFMIGTAADLFLAANVEHVWVYTFSSSQQASLWHRFHL